MLFNPDIRQNFTVKEVNLEKQKQQKRNFRQKVVNMKESFMLIQY